MIYYRSHRPNTGGFNATAIVILSILFVYADNVSAFRMVNLFSNRANWWMRTAMISSWSSNSLNIAVPGDCIDGKTPAIIEPRFDGSVIWNRAQPRELFAKAVAFYYELDCGETNKEPAYPVIIIVLDQKNLEGLNFADLRKFNLRQKWQAIEDFDIDSARRTGGILSNIEGNLDGAVLVQTSRTSRTYTVHLNVVQKLDPGAIGPKVKKSFMGGYLRHKMEEAFSADNMTPIIEEQSKRFYNEIAKVSKSKTNQEPMVSQPQQQEIQTESESGDDESQQINERQPRRPQRFMGNRFGEKYLPIRDLKYMLEHSGKKATDPETVRDYVPPKMFLQESLRNAVDDKKWLDTIKAYATYTQMTADLATKMYNERHVLKAQQKEAPKIQVQRLFPESPSIPSVQSWKIGPLGVVAKSTSPYDQSPVSGLNKFNPSRSSMGGSPFNPGMQFTLASPRFLPANANPMMLFAPAYLGPNKVISTGQNPPRADTMIQEAARQPLRQAKSQIEGVARNPQPLAQDLTGLNVQDFFPDQNFDFDASMIDMLRQEAQDGSRYIAPSGIGNARKKLHSDDLQGQGIGEPGIGGPTENADDAEEADFSWQSRPSGETAKRPRRGGKPT